MAKKIKDDMVTRNEETEEIIQEPKKVKTKGGKLAGLEEGTVNF